MAAAEIAGIAIGGIQALIDAGKAKRANRDLKRLFSQRKAFKTPSEVFDILNLSQFNAQQGFSDDTMAYLTNQAGAGLSAGLGAATRLGADPNQLSGMIDQYFSNIFRVGAESDMVKMKRFNDFSNALQLVAANEEAEQISKDNLIKDQMAAASQRLGAAQTGIQSGLNFAVNSAAILASNDIYGLNKKRRPDLPPAGVDTSAYTVTEPSATRKVDLSTGTQRGNFSI